MISLYLFTTPQLTSNDFTACSWNGQPCFNYLASQSAKYYTPSLAAPVSYLRSRIWSGPVRTVNANDDFSVAAGETVFIEFTGFHPTQQDRLAAHDVDIKGIVARLGEKGITYVYTAAEEHNVLHRAARQAKQDVEEPVYAPVLLSRGLNYIIALNTIQHAPNFIDPRTNVTVAGAAVTYAGPTSPDTTRATLTVATTPALVLNIVADGGRWWVDQVTFDGRRFTDGNWLGANRGFSFSCSPDLVFATNDTVEQYLFVGGLQLQVELEPEEGVTQLNFGPDNNCVGFTSGGIWGGLFVTLLLLIIITIGISWMLDIKTMDRFDDPKGKTITINASD